MTVRLSRFLTTEEYHALNNDAMERGYWRDDHRIFQPGWGWHEPFYWDPAKAAALGLTKDSPGEALHEAGFYGSGLLSRFYWERWSAIRPPICVVLPNSVQWEIDRKSSNGEGWTVEGDWPFLQCSPSIAANGYHGFLGSSGAAPGEFTNALDAGPSEGVYPYPRTWLRRVQFDPSDPRRVYSETEPGDPPADFRQPPEPDGGFIYCQKPV